MFAFCCGLCLAFVFAFPALAAQENELVFYRLELTSTMRNRGNIQPDGSTRHHLMLYASDGYIAPEAPEAYYVVTKSRPRMRRGAQADQAKPAPLPPPVVYRADTKLEDTGWALETAIGGQVQIEVYVKVNRDGKNYYTSAAFAVNNNPSPEYVQPPGTSMPEGWPSFRLELQNRGEMNWRVESPMKISFDAKRTGSDGTLIIADSMNKSMLPLEFAKEGRLPSLSYTPPDDPVLNSSGRSNKQITLIAPLADGGNASISTNISRNSQLHSNRTAGFITAGASFAGSLFFALFMRLRFKEPHKRARRVAITAGVQNAN